MCETPVDPVARLWETGQWEKIIPFAENDLIRARGAKDPAGEADTLNCLTFLYSQVGRKCEAVEVARAETRVRRGLGEPSDYAFSLAALAFALERNQQGQGALRVSHRALTLYRHLGDRDGIREQSCQKARLLRAHGHCEEALPILEQALALATENVEAPARALILEMLAQTHRELRNLPEALRYQRESIRVLLDDGAYPVEALLFLAKLHLEAGETWQAREILDATLQHIRQYGKTAESEAIREQIQALEPKKSRGGSMLARFGLKGASRRRDC